MKANLTDLRKAEQEALARCVRDNCPIHVYLWSDESVRAVSFEEITAGRRLYWGTAYPNDNGGEWVKSNGQWKVEVVA